MRRTAFVVLSLAVLMMVPTAKVWLAQTGYTAVPAATSGGESPESLATLDAKISKLARAMLALSQRMTALEKKSGTGASSDKEGKETAAKLQALQGTVTSMTQEINSLKAQVASDQQAIAALHQRLSAIDGKSGSLKLGN